VHGIDGYGCEYFERGEATRRVALSRTDHSSALQHETRNKRARQPGLLCGVCGTTEAPAFPRSAMNAEAEMRHLHREISCGCGMQEKSQRINGECI
jgi:hypothetical protein